jgi:hypothetical protein
MLITTRAVNARTQVCGNKSVGEAGKAEGAKQPFEEAAGDRLEVSEA